MNANPNEPEQIYIPIIDCLSCNCNLYDNEKNRNMVLCNNCTRKILNEHTTLNNSDSGQFDFSQFAQEKTNRQLERQINYSQVFNRK